MTVLLSKAKRFAKYDEEAREIYIRRKDANKMTPGESYKFRVFLSDAHMSLEFTFAIKVANLTSFELPQLASSTEGGEGGSGGDNEEGEDGGFNEGEYSSLNGPTPSIKSITHRGKIEITFDKEVKLADLEYMMNSTVEVDGV